MRLLVRASLLVVLWSLCVGAQSVSSVLTSDQRAWVEQHRVVRYAVDPAWKPLEYISNGRHIGLSRDYLNRLAAISGLRFVLVPTHSWRETLDAMASGQVEMLPAVPASFPGAPDFPDVLFTRPYYSGQTLVVTAANRPVIQNIDALQDRIVAVHAGGIYERWLRTHYPAIHLQTYNDTESMCSAVLSGQVYAALGGDALLHPVLRQRYAALHIAGILPNAPLELRMAVRSDLQPLQEILDRSLSSLTAQEQDEIYSGWIEAADYGAPSLIALLRYYGSEIFLGLLAFVIALYALWQARRAAQCATQAERQKSLFLAMMSHEIRNPMQTILSSIELLGHVDMSSQARKLLDAANAASVQLFRLLGDILDYSRLEAKKLELSLEPVDPLVVAHNAVMQIERAASQKGLSTPLIAPAKLPFVMADPVRVHQIISNLLSNAVKYTPAGSVMTTLNISQPDVLSGSVQLSIEIRDTGPGMPKTVLDQLFRPFVQGSSVAKQTGGGSGLGLSICRALVDMMDGKIEVQSREREGTLVSVTLPLQLASEPPVSRDAVPLGARLPSVRALVVEDEPLNQYVLVAQLGALGVAVDVRATGEEALQTFREQDFSIVFLDCQLADMDGYETARQIRAHETSEGLPPVLLVALSANGGQEHQQRCRECGMDVVLSKPVGLVRLEQILSQHIGVRTMDSMPTASVVEIPNDVFLDSVAADLQEFEQAMEQDDFARCEQLAHRVKGAALVAEQPLLAEIARAMQDAVHRNCAPDVRAKLTRIYRVLGQLHSQKASR